LRPIFNEAKFAFDVIYGKKTPFLNLAAASGLRHKDGLYMLLFQAALALNLFFDGSLDETKIENAMQKALRPG
jgi:shikimate dehydrogenase